MTSGDSLEGSDIGFDFGLAFFVGGSIGCACETFLVRGGGSISELVVAFFRFFLGGSVDSGAAVCSLGV